VVGLLLLAREGRVLAGAAPVVVSLAEHGALRAKDARLERALGLGEVTARLEEVPK